jgi:hypothetical protein
MHRWWDEPVRAEAHDRVDPDWDAEKQAENEAGLYLSLANLTRCERPVRTEK